MGFLTPGKSTKRRAREHKENVREKRTRISVSPPLTRPVAPQPRVVKEPTPEPEKPKSILERLPVEIIHEIFIIAHLNELPFTCKQLNRDLTPTRTLRTQMLKNYIVDLNCGVVPLIKTHKTRYALDIKVLDYGFASAEALEQVRFDTVLSRDKIQAEKRNRLILHFDHLNKMMLDTLKRADASADEINTELERIAREREELDIVDIELSELTLDKTQDFPERFYNGSFNEAELATVEELCKRTMKFIQGGRVLSSAIEKGCDLSTISRLLDCTETATVTDSLPIIAAFERGDTELVDWLLTKCEDEESMLNDDQLWISLSRNRSHKHLRFLEKRGGVPSHEILGTITANLRDV